MDSQGYLAICYAVSVVLVVGTAVYALATGFILRRKISSTEDFITARHQVGAVRIGWSFYAGAVGAWVISSPANYASFAGMLGVVFYALATGLPFLMIAYAGEAIRTKLPHVLSLTDYIGWRFGLAAKTYVAVLCLFYQSIALLVEFTTIGSIFADFVGSVPYPMVVTVGLLTMGYTAYGGLLVSIYTDQVQGAASVLLFGVVAIYLAVTFRPASLPTPMPCGPTDPFCISGTPNCAEFTDFCAPCPADCQSQGNCPAGCPSSCPVTCPTSGYSSILAMPASLFAANIFSEATWQRVWASRDKKALRLGAVLGCIGVVLAVFFAGLCGLLAAWAGLISLGTDPSKPATNPNLYLFQVLAGGQPPSTPTVSNWVGVLCVALAAVMNAGAVDSLQNGMAAAVTSYVAPMVKGWTLSATRWVVVVVNATLIGVAVWLVTGTVKVTVNELFLLANILCCTSAFPVLAGLSERLHRCMGGGSFLFSCIFSIFCTCVFGVTYYYDKFPNGFTDPVVPGRVYVGGSLSWALFYTWIGNNYSWQFFLVPICVSIGSVALCVLLNWALLRCSRQPALPGFVAPATHPALFLAAPSLSTEGSSGSDDRKTAEDCSPAGLPPCTAHEEGVQ